MGNLINRYRAVLRKCRVKNAVSRMVLAGALLAAPLFAEGLSSITGGTGTAYAGIYSLDGQAQDFVNNGYPQKDDAESSNLGITPPGIVGIEHADDKIYGGLATTPSPRTYNSIASDNHLTVEIHEGEEACFSDEVIAGYTDNKGFGDSTANGNHLTINNNGKTSFSQRVIAGYAGSHATGNSTANNNILTINGNGKTGPLFFLGKTVPSPVAVRAGYADNWETGSSEASGNQLYFRDAILEASEASGLAGGLAKLNTGSQGSHVIANKNEVHISGTKTEIRSNVNGGNAMTNNFAQAGSMAQANENKVFITDGASVIGTVCGAQINGNKTDTNGWYAEAHDNFVEIKDSSFGPQNGSTDGTFSVYGAVMYAWRVRNAYKNEVEISNSNFTGGHQDDPNKSSVTALSIYSFSDPVEVRGNSVRISKSIIDGYNILGTNISTTDRAGVSNTTVEVSNGSNIGGYVGGDFVSARSGVVIAEGERSVSVSDSTIGGYIQGLDLSTSHGNASAQGGSVSVSHSVVGSYILGDNVAAPEGSASVFGGSVSVSSGTTVKGFISGLSVNAKKAIAEGGSVSVWETTFAGYVFGASTTVKQNSSATSRASRNTVTIENSKIGNLVYGGYAVNKSSGIAEASGIF